MGSSESVLSPDMAVDSDVKFTLITAEAFAARGKYTEALAIIRKLAEYGIVTSERAPDADLVRKYVASFLERQNKQTYI